MKRVIAFWKLPWHEKKIFLQGAWLLFRIERALKSQKFAAVRTNYERRFLIQPLVSIIVSAQRITELVQLANWHSHLRVSCLRESLALWCLLRQYGYQPQIKVGVTAPKAGFEAHAWVELDAEVLNDTADVVQQYIVLEDKGSI